VVGTARLAVREGTPTVSTLAGAWRERIKAENPTFDAVRWESTVEVPVTTLDVLIEHHGVPAFCKIDVEGFEAEVLAGLSHPIPALSVEFVAGGLDVAIACIQRLATLADYRFNVVLGEGRSFVFDEWEGAMRISEWMEAGAGGASSGDLYARRA
jgi:hypothetical protein